MRTPRVPQPQPIAGDGGILPQIESKNPARIFFEELDQDYRLKMRAFIKLCMPGAFATLQQQAPLEVLRGQGIVPIMFYLRFGAPDLPLVFGQALQNQHSIRLTRGVPPARPGAPAQSRLMVDMEIRLTGRQGSHDPAALGRNTGEGAELEAGTMRALHVLTNPLAKVGARHPGEVPECLRGYQVHDLQGPYPDMASLQQIPQGYVACGGGRWDRMESVWGLQNTDINQHVNVQEYIMGFENLFSCLLHNQGLPLKNHHIQKTEIVFRKPFFPGNRFQLQGQLFLKEGATCMLAGFHGLLPDGGFDPRPATFTVMRGSVREV